MAAPIGLAEKSFRLRKFLLLSALIASLPEACFLGTELEAHRKAEEFLQAYMSKCGESSFSKEGFTIYEFRDVSIVLRGRELSKAEELNGLEYQSNGALEFTSRSADLIGKVCWSEWRSGNQYFNMDRKKGAWTISSPLQNDSPVDCAFAHKIAPCDK